MTETTTRYEVWRVVPETTTGYGDSAWAVAHNEEDAQEKLDLVRTHWPDKTFEARKVVTTREGLDW